MNSGSDFSGVKVGDRLWYMDKEVQIVEVDPNSIYSLLFIHNGSVHSATTLGKEHNGGPQVLFWDKVEIAPPPRPRRLVKKTVEVRPYLSDNRIKLATLYLNATNDFRYCGPIQPIEIEVEE